VGGIGVAAAVAAAVAVLLVLNATTTSVHAPVGAGQTPVPWASPSNSTSADASMDPTPSPSVPATGATSAGAVSSAVVGGRGSDATSSLQQRLAGCLYRAEVSPVPDATLVTTVKWDDPGNYCPPGAYARVFWASYYTTTDGSGVLFASGGPYQVDKTTPTLQFKILKPVNCAIYFVVTGPAAIKQTLTAAAMAGQVDAYPNSTGSGPPDSVFWNVGNCPPSAARPTLTA
jgi:hypothetical protein